MKILRAKKHPKTDLPLQLFNVAELICIPREPWLKKRIEEFEYNKSFENHGMIWPICVTDEKPKWVDDRLRPKNPWHYTGGKLNPGLYVHTGNKRVYWAKENGYDQIEGYMMYTIEHKRDLRRMTSINHKEIPK